MGGGGGGTEGRDPAEATIWKPRPTSKHGYARVQTAKSGPESEVSGTCKRNPVLRTCSRKRRMIFGQSSTCDIRPPAQIAGCGCCCVHTARSSLGRPSFVAWCLSGCAKK